MLNKYIKPKSLTWWSSLVPLIAGIFIAAEPLHGFSQAVQAVQNATGMTAPLLINLGLAGIGLRGAVSR